VETLTNKPSGRYVRTVRDPQRTIQGILAAAESVVLRKGLQSTTIEEVARAASISKGGVLHHFPTKDSILVGLLQLLVARFEANVEGYRSEDPEPKGAFTRAFFRATLRRDANCVELFSALSSAFHNTPALLAVQRENYSRWQGRLQDDGIDPVHASIVRFAANGLWVARAHQMGLPPEEILNSVIESLFSLSRGEGLPGLPHPLVTERAQSAS
jgi:AcrR family transcriptional regulator